jgi:hypothetical protein
MSKAKAAKWEPAPGARVEHEVDIRYPVDGGPVDADGWPIVAGCHVSASVPSVVCPGFTNEWVGPVLRVVRVENGRDDGRVLCYIGADGTGPWGAVAPIGNVRVRRKPREAKAQEMRDAADDL